MFRVIHWKDLDRAEFETAVEALLARMYASSDHFQIPNGRGGDDGIDAIVVQGNRNTIFQLKHFPEGISGGFRHRRRQITQSLEAAVAHAPTDWVLVVPCTLTRSEHAFIQQIETTHPVRKRVMDLPALNSEMAKLPDLVNYLQRSDHLESRARLFKAEQAVLLGGVDDITDRMRGLQSVIDELDPHWTLSPSVDGTVVTHTIKAKHPRAAELSPINISFSASPPPGSEIADKWERVLGYGAHEAVTFTATMVSEFRVDGPKWLAGEREVAELSYFPIPNDGSKEVEVELLFLDTDQSLLASHTGRSRHLGAGDKGVSLDCVFYDCVTLKLGFPHNQQDDGRCNMSVDISRADVPTMIEATNLILQLNTVGQSIKVRIDGHDLAKLMFGPSTSSWLEEVVYMHDLAEDLDTVQRAARARFPIPAEITQLDRVTVRSLRLMLDGKCVVHPQMTQTSFTLNGEKSEALIQALRGQGVMAISPGAGEHIRLLGRDLSLPQIRYVLVNPVVAEAESVIAALDEGTAAGMVVTFRLPAGEHVRMFMPDRWPDPNTPLAPTPWSLPGIEQVGIVADTPIREDKSIESRSPDHQTTRAPASDQ